MILGVLNPKHLVRAALEMVQTLSRHRALLMEQIRRELFDAHAGQILGGVWSLLHPLFLMMIYVFVFSFVYKSRLGGTRELPLDYTSYILSGLAPWLAIVQSLSKSTTALTSNANLIKQVVFPIEILPAKAVLSTLIPLFVMLAVYFAYTTGWSGHLLATHLMLPVLLFIYILWTLGLGMMLSSLAVFVRDVRELVQLSATAGIFVLPVIYLPQWVPAIFKPVLYINPLSHVIWCFQDALYFGRFEHPWSWGVALGGGMLVFALGARTLRGLKPYFGDVL